VLFVTILAAILVTIITTSFIWMPWMTRSDCVAGATQQSTQPTQLQHSTSADEHQTRQTEILLAKASTRAAELVDKAEGKVLSDSILRETDGWVGTACHPNSVTTEHGNYQMELAMDFTGMTWNKSLTRHVTSLSRHTEQGGVMEKDACISFARGRFTGPGTHTSKRKPPHVCKRPPAVNHEDAGSVAAWKERRTSTSKGKGKGKSKGTAEEIHWCDAELPTPFQSNVYSATVDMPATWYSRAELHRKLKGRAIVFIGNSITRQLYARAFHWLRHQLVLSDHYYHTNSIYGFDRDGDAHDICYPLGVECNGSPAFWANFRNKSEVAILKLITDQPYLDDMDQEGFDAVCGGSGVHGFEYNLQQQLPVTHAVAGVVQQCVGPRGKQFWVGGVVAATWLITRHGGTLPNGDPNCLFYQCPLNQRLRPWLQLDMHRMHLQNLKGWPKLNEWICVGDRPTFDPEYDPNRCSPFGDCHFQCMWYPEYTAAHQDGTLPAMDRGMTALKVPPNGDCTDPLNLNAVQRVFAFLFDDYR